MERFVIDFHLFITSIAHAQVIGGITFRPFNKEGYVSFIEVHNEEIS
jgi:hypothetical protein